MAHTSSRTTVVFIVVHLFVRSFLHFLLKKLKQNHYGIHKPHLVAHETEYLKKSDDLWTHCVSISQTA
ncbi:hypothetical protein HID58_087047 [Brassica napus]|uniref:Uncharacterized protein n=2 Tax=Brassica TaxID=3705 RepID=A0A3P6E540_BRAOL|nr:hypothetical protein HID58_087047 [Brassica napus]CAF1747872.1 unnamed protein product [Brassica napus]VDD31241.1 unnamed protein product [Brassica oleracea]